MIERFMEFAGSFEFEVWSELHVKVEGMQKKFFIDACFSLRTSILNCIESVMEGVRIMRNDCKFIMNRFSMIFYESLSLLK